MATVPPSAPRPRRLPPAGPIGGPCGAGGAGGPAGPFRVTLPQPESADRAGRRERGLCAPPLPGAASGDERRPPPSRETLSRSQDLPLPARGPRPAGDSVPRSEPHLPRRADPRASVPSTWWPSTQPGLLARPNCHFPRLPQPHVYQAPVCLPGWDFHILQAHFTGADAEARAAEELAAGESVRAVWGGTQPSLPLQLPSLLRHHPPSRPVSCPHPGTPRTRSAEPTGAPVLSRWRHQDSQEPPLTRPPYVRMSSRELRAWRGAEALPDVFLNAQCERNRGLDWKGLPGLRRAVIG